MFRNKYVKHVNSSSTQTGLFRLQLNWFSHTLSSQRSSGCKDSEFCQHRGIWCLLFQHLRRSLRCVQRKQDLRNVKANWKDCCVEGKLKGDWMSFPERCDCKHVFCCVSACFMCVCVCATAAKQATEKSPTIKLCQFI